MKWFKHYADASRGVSLSMVHAQFGAEGMLAYFLLLELASQQYGVEYASINGEKFIFHERILKEYLRVSTGKVERFLRFFQETKMLFFKKTEKIYEIEIPKMRSILDNHTKNLQATCQKLASNLPLDKEKDKEKEKDISPLPPLGEFVTLIEFWNSKNIKTHAATHELASKVQAALKKKKLSVDKAMLCINNYAMVLNTPGSFFKYRWPLLLFLKREGAEAFWPENFIYENYLKLSEANSDEFSMSQKEMDDMVARLKD